MSEAFARLFLMALDLHNGRNDVGAPFNDFQKGR
jgi:hypothetical protein